MKSMLFHRLALCTDKQEVLKLASEGQIIEKPEDILKEPYVFEFTGLPQLPVYEEGELEEALVNNLSMFFLELGKGFTYVGRQQKMVIGVRTPELKIMAKEILKAGDYKDFMRELPHEYFEENQLHAFILSGMKDYDECMEELERFLPYVMNKADPEILNTRR